MDNYTATEMAYKNGYEQGRPRWISVKERLPEEDVDVLTYRAKTGYVEVSHRMKWRWLDAAAGASEGG